MAEVPVSGSGAHIGKSVVIKGELSGSEDLFLDGHVSGAIELKGHTLTIGPNGQVKANINARSVVLHGKLEGDILASDRVELRKSAIMVGSINTQRVSVEDGAYLNGQVDTQKEAPKTEAQAQPRITVAPNIAPPASAPSANVSSQGAMF